MKINIKKGFTLIEIIIVVFIFGLLSTVLIRTYILISEINVRIEQEKNVTQELLFLSEVIQNFADKSTIDYDRYMIEYHETYLKDNNGITNRLFLKSQDDIITIESQGNCNTLDEDNTELDLEIKKKYIEERRNCKITVDINGKTIDITNNKVAYFNRILFRIIPFATEEQYFGQQGYLFCETNYMSCFNSPGFWVLGNTYSINYGKSRVANIKIPIQQFFNLQRIK